MILETSVKPEMVVADFSRDTAYSSVCEPKRKMKKKKKKTTKKRAISMSRISPAILDTSVKPELVAAYFSRDMVYSSACEPKRKMKKKTADPLSSSSKFGIV